MSKIEQQIASLAAQQRELARALNDERSRKKFKCECCGGMHAFRDCVAIQTHWYESPSGCMGGDNWHSGELQIICPVTNNKNRLLWPSHYTMDYSVRRDIKYNAELQFKWKYGDLFKETVQDYDKDRRPWINNTYIDENRKRFGLHVQGLDKHPKVDT